MYFLIPLGQEDASVRRIPWVTATIAAICILAHVFFTLPENAKLEHIYEKLDEAINYFAEHPYLEPSPEFVAEMRKFGIELETEQVFGKPDRRPSALESPPGREDEPEEGGYAAPELLEPDYAPPDAPSSVPEAFSPNLRAEQAHLDQLFAEFQKRRASQGERLGLIPADFELFDVIAAIFLHADWIHLFSNLFIFWLCGPALEDLWGRPFFAAFFLLGGILSGLFWMALNLHTTVPLVGASGAIAGLMGAYAIRFWSGRILFFWFFTWLLPPRIFKGTFSAPVWLTLGLWFADEIWSMMRVQAEGISSGVAFAGHVGGFAFGALAAVAIARTKLEDRYLAPAIERQLEVGSLKNDELSRAFGAIEKGHDEEAWGILMAGLRERPSDGDLALALWDLATRLGRRELAVAPVVRQLKLELRGGDRLLALQRWDEVRELALPKALDADLAWRLAEAQLAEGQREEARDLLDLLPLAAATGQQLAVKVRLLKAAAESGSRLTLPLAEHCAALSDLPEPIRVQVATAVARGREIEAEQRARARSLEGVESIPLLELPVRAPAPASPPLAGAAPLAAAPWRIFDGVPLRFVGDSLEVADGAATHQFKLPGLAAVAVARIDEAKGPYLLIDLFLDPPTSAAARVVRLRSTRYDPRRELAPEAAEPMAAFLAFVQKLLQQSAARPLPSATAAKGQPFARFATITEYELALRF